MKSDVGSKSLPELEGLAPEWLAELVEGSGRAKAVWRALADGRDPSSDPGLSGALRSLLSERTRRTRLEIRKRTVADCGTTKLGLSLADGKAVETVLIPSSGRSTVCVSTQAGCARGCVFCMTATLGLERGLSAGEIVGQVLIAAGEARRAGRPGVRNVVYMGMGEPLDNLEAVTKSVNVLLSPAGLGLGGAHVTVSTIGTSPEAIIESARIPVRMAWSLHAVDESLRRRLVPTARYSPGVLREAFLERGAITGKGLFVEMTLLRDLNDGVSEAEALADFLEPFDDVRVNLLPMNPGRNGVSASPMERAVAYRDRVRERGRFCAIRRPRGVERGAACGQLAAADVL